MQFLHKPREKITFVFTGFSEYPCDKGIRMFIAQIILCSSLLGKCVGFEDSNLVNIDLVTCEKRAEALVQDVSLSMPHFVVAHARCKKIPGFSA